MNRASASGLVLLTGLLQTSVVRAESNPPAAVQELDVTEHLGAQVPLDLVFRDGAGNPVRLRDWIRGDKPILLTTGYFRCPVMCGLALRGVAAGVKELGWQAGDQFRLLTISFDPGEGPELAKERQRTVVSATGGKASAGTWPFWTGEQQDIDRLLEVLGTPIVRDPATGQIAHTAVSFVLTPDGRISRYVYGLEPRALDLKLALVEASEGKTGSAIDRLILRCFKYDPAMRRYAPFLLTYFRTGGALLLLGLGTWVAVMLRREHATLGPVRPRRPVGSRP
ncbi:SCO family protein [Myxococcota bacterium]|nr:SCO family protein [Myxococcota bacterium]